MRYAHFAGWLVGCMTLTACVTTSGYETVDLLTITHNVHNDCTLLVYRDTMGNTRQVLRRKGVFEIELTDLGTGEYMLKERGRQVRSINAATYRQIEQHFHLLLYTESKSPPVTSGVVTGQEIE